MKTIGLIGGMSWESTVSYYESINKKVQEELGGLHSAKCILYSVDFYEIEKYQSMGQWEKAGEILLDIGRKLERAGADCIVLCTNTMHKVADIIINGIDIPFIHIGESTVDRILENNIKKVGLLGTKYTMEEDFYKSKIVERNIDVIIPEIEDIEIINNIIFDELCLGIIRENSKIKFIEIINKLMENGAEGIILGCTEIGLLLKQEDIKIPLFDTTKIHVEKAVEFALNK